MATQMQLKVYLEGNHMAARAIKRKKHRQSRVFLALFFMNKLLVAKSADLLAAKKGFFN